jgi:hypothetical protein
MILAVHLLMKREAQQWKAPRNDSIDDRKKTDMNGRNGKVFD